jgi:RNAse (barnase) inhibitor barstar
MPTVCLDGEKITTWDAFHSESQAVFGFPGFYGRNIDAWIDCLSTLREEDGMTKFMLGPYETLEIEVPHSDALRQQAPEIVRALKEYTAIVNQLYIGNGGEPALGLALR